jgi:hypothetical protein
MLLAAIIMAMVQEKLYNTYLWAIWIPILLIPVAALWPIRSLKALGYTLIPSITAYLISEFIAPDSELDVLFLVCACLPPVTLLPVPAICFFRIRMAEQANVGDRQEDSD